MPKRLARFKTGWFLANTWANKADNLPVLANQTIKEIGKGRRQQQAG
jgi:hypothetical protein